MKLVIDIPKEKYEAIKDKYGTFPAEWKEWGLEAIRNGKELEIEKEPKEGHWKREMDNTGRLVWECEYCRWQQRFFTRFCPDCGAEMGSFIFKK